ncbi:MAG: MBL fold metallo-hydrolase [Dehalococcoidia bacterium]
MKISEHVYRVHINEDDSPFGTYHPGGSNIYFIGDPNSNMVIMDTGEHYRSWTDQILSYHKELGSPNISNIYITHGHYDHIGGVDRLQKEFQCKVGCHSNLKTKLEMILQEGIVFSIEDQEALKINENITLLALYTPGHENDHICYFLQEEQIMFTGDTVLGSSSSSVRNLKEYMNSLEIILEYKPNKVYPAHGALVEDGTAKITSYIQHRKQREEQIIKALTKNASQTVYEIVDFVYPKDLNPNLREAAARNVRTHLEKLSEEGKIEETNPLYSLNNN